MPPQIGTVEAIHGTGHSNTRWCAVLLVSPECRIAINSNGMNANFQPYSGGSSSLLVSAQQFLRQPSQVGSAFPASRYLVDALLDPVDWSKASVVVEYGPGSGPVTRALLARMPRKSCLVAIDLSPHFTHHLRSTIRDPRLLAVTACAGSAGAILNHHRLERADAVVTGIPFSTMTKKTGARILDVSADVLQSDGQLLAYQMRSTIAPMLAQRFADIKTSRVWRNLPPCHLYWATSPVA